MLTRLYHWMLAKAAHRHADRWLGVISFMESSFFPIPPDALLVPMCLAQPKRAFYYAFVCTAASVLGALLGYAIGYFLFDTIGQSILGLYGLEDKYATFADAFNDQGWIIVFLAGFTPLPFKVITIAAGATAMPLYILVGASIVSRSARFFLEAALLWKFGEPMKRIIDRHFALITTLGGILLVGGFLAISMLAGKHEGDGTETAPTHNASSATH